MPFELTSTILSNQSIAVVESLNHLLLSKEMLKLCKHGLLMVVIRIQRRLINYQGVRRRQTQEDQKSKLNCFQLEAPKGAAPKHARRQVR